jgi:tetratricopeptide (TPR) repeat protein
MNIPCDSPKWPSALLRSLSLFFSAIAGAVAAAAEHSGSDGNNEATGSHRNANCHCGDRDPGDASSHNSRFDLDRLARQLYREKKYDDAAHALERAASLKPADPVLLNNLGFMYYEMGRYNDAVI